MLIGLEPRVTSALSQGLLLSAALSWNAMASAATATSASAEMTQVQSMPPSSVTGLDPLSHATVPLTIGHVTLDIPRNVLAGRTPEFAFLYPGMIPIPADRVAEFRVLSAARHPDLIHVVLVGQDEPARVAAFVGPWNNDKLEPGPYGLERLRAVPSILVAFPGTPDTLGIYVPISGKLDQTEQCDARRYIFGDMKLSYEFNASLLPHWADINQKLSKLLGSWSRK